MGRATTSLGRPSPSTPERRRSKQTESPSQSIPGPHTLRFVAPDGTAKSEARPSSTKETRHERLRLFLDPNRRQRPRCPCRPRRPRSRSGFCLVEAGKGALGTAGIVVGAVGLAGVAAGIVAYVSGSSQVSGIPSWPGDPTGCDSSGNCHSKTSLDQYNQGTSLQNIGMGLVIGGGVATVAGLVMWIAAPVGSERAGSEGTSLRVGLAPTGLFLKGLFY